MDINVLWTERFPKKYLDYKPHFVDWSSERLFKGYHCKPDLRDGKNLTLWFVTPKTFYFKDWPSYLNDSNATEIIFKK